MENSFVETSAILTGKRTEPFCYMDMNDYRRGGPGSVEFSWEWVFDQEDKFHDVIGFYHTHSKGIPNYSSTDIETMKQWVKCLGKDLICVIECDGKLNAWFFSSKEIKKVPYCGRIGSTVFIWSNLWKFSGMKLPQDKQTIEI